ncbi:MAG: dephospho-CoA kinase [Verrucomicrobiota bacterium]
MPVLGITGGIATGKSTFTRQLLNWLPAACFDADSVARELLDGDPEVRESVRDAFGANVIGPGGIADRAALREIVFGDAGKRQILEEILHPPIRARWAALAKLARETGAWLLVDIPLLFETGVESEFDTVVVVACREATQRARIVSERRLSSEIAVRIIDSQQSLKSKIARAGHVVWSDCPMARMENQAQIFAGYLEKRYG